MKTLDEILAPLAEKTYDELKPVALAIGLSVDTLYKITKGYTRRPSFQHVRLIAEHFDRKPKRKAARTRKLAAKVK